MTTDVVWMGCEGKRKLLYQHDIKPRLGEDELAKPGGGGAFYTVEVMDTEAVSGQPTGLAWRHGPERKCGLRLQEPQGHQ